ncbi:MAG: hypothetical protein KF757_09450 [Phycisphaeraceae bacterium]|nr:hypothetical protein [Phycisphaeraceae bacterium]MCW5763433.1 hypothetical protein [Phycisphaeraceae bacterium]
MNRTVVVLIVIVGAAAVSAVLGRVLFGSNGAAIGGAVGGALGGVLWASSRKKAG